MPILEPTAPATSHAIGYLQRAFENPAHLLTETMNALKNEQYDTLVGTGLSGALVVPTLARALGRHWMIVRKPNDGAHGAWAGLAVGNIGARWVFVDDQIDSGATFCRVYKEIRALEDSPSTFVGALLYHPMGGYPSVFRPSDSLGKYIVGC
jgi:orotate phosphoribosyltransferase